MIKDADSARRAEEAADWYALLNNTRVANSDIEAFFAWRRDAANLAAYEKLEDIGRLARSLGDDPDMRAAAQAALVRKPAPVRVPVRVPTRSGPRFPRWWGAIAMATVLAGAVIGWRVFDGETYTTGVGQRLNTQLSDGSRLQLNTDTKVRIRFSDGERRVELLRGQAFFDVAHDKARPFIVAAGPTQVRAIGTRFDVRKIDQAVRVTLAEGRVSVRDPAAPAGDWTLSAGQSVLVGDKTTAAPARADVASATGWTQGQITFHDVTLAEAAAEINRYSRTKIVLGEGAAPAAKVNGVFQTGDTQEFVAAVSDAFELQAQRRLDGAIELRGRHPPG
jgi:transmembrane sensor